MIHLTIREKLIVILIAVLVISVMAVVAILASCNFFETGALDCNTAVGCIITKPGCL